MGLSLARALRVDSAMTIAFSGAGGKTTAMFQLARSLSGDKGTEPVIVTATSHLGAWQFQLADQHIVAETPAPLAALEDRLQGVTLITGGPDGDRSKPIDHEMLEWLHAFCGDHAIPLLIEADGSRGKPLKGWAEHEPPIPAFVDLVVQVAGLTGLGQPLNDTHIHRAEIFSQLSGLTIGNSITPEALIRVLTHNQGGLKNIPEHARRIALLNQADTGERQSAAKALAQSLLRAYHSVVIASLEQGSAFAVHEPVAGIVLAAGASARFGQPKQLLDWRGQPFVRAVARTALEAGLQPVIVVTGANAEKVEAALHDLDVVLVRNGDWERGQASSIQAAIPALKATTPAVSRNTDLARRVGAAIFLLADQPQVNPSVLRALVEKHAEGLYPIVAPMVIDRRANPVLFDLRAFPDLMRLEGDVGGRAAFHSHRVEYLPWHDDRLLLDVDTPEMYQRLISDETL